MTTTLHTALARVLELAWQAEVVGQVGVGFGGFPTLEESLEAAEQTHKTAANAALAFLREYGPRLVANAKDAEQWRGMTAAVRDALPKVEGVPTLAAACYLLIDRCEDINAATADYKFAGMTSGDKEIGDWRVVVKRTKKPNTALGAQGGGDE